MTHLGDNVGVDLGLKPDEFQLRIEFSGLCLFVTRRDRTGAVDPRRITVLMPDARREPSVDIMRHYDGTEAIPHSGYVRFDLGDLMPGLFAVAPNNSAGPRNEGIHRFDREELTIDFGDPEPVNVDELEFPDFGKIDGDLRVNPAMLGESPPDQLLMRMDLTGGEFTAHAGGSNWTFPEVKGANGPYQGQFANYVTWTRVMKRPPLEVSIGRFGQKPRTFKLHPSANRLIRLKIANLCAENPLEWPDLKLRVIGSDQDQDKDFKWLYRLFAIRGAVPVPVGSTPASRVDLLVPILDRTSGPASAEQDCTGGKGDE